MKTYTALLVIIGFIALVNAVEKSTNDSGMTTSETLPFYTQDITSYFKQLNLGMNREKRTPNNGKYHNLRKNERIDKMLKNGRLETSIVRETPTVVRVHPQDTAYLMCRVKNLGTGSVIWLKENKVLTIDTTVLANNERLKPSHDEQTGTWLLEVRPVSMVDAGKYECRVNSKTPLSHVVSLDVIPQGQSLLKSLPSAPLQQMENNISAIWKEIREIRNEIEVLQLETKPSPKSNGLNHPELNKTGPNHQEESEGNPHTRENHQKPQQSVAKPENSGDNHQQQSPLNSSYPFKCDFPFDLQNIPVELSINGSEKIYHIEDLGIAGNYHIRIPANLNRKMYKNVELSFFMRDCLNGGYSKWDATDNIVGMFRIPRFVEDVNKQQWAYYAPHSLIYNDGYVADHSLLLKVRKGKKITYVCCQPPTSTQTTAKTTGSIKPVTTSIRFNG